MSRLRPCLVAAAFAAAIPGALRAQGSNFAVHGLGLPGRAVTARDAALGGAFGIVDPTSTANPGAVGLWRGLAGWGVGAPSWRTFDGTTGDGTSRATRFPLFGFATQFRPKVGLSVSVGDYLDRNWRVTQSDTIIVPARGDTVPFSDQSRSVGGVSDLRLAAAYRLSPRVAVGAGLHALIGSTQLSVTRDFADASYDDYIDISISDFSGLGLSAGVIAAVSSQITLGASVRRAGDLKVNNTSGARARVALPFEARMGGSVMPVPGVTAVATAHYAGFARGNSDLLTAGLDPARNTWSLGLGLEVDRTNLLLVRTPLRLGWRWRQLPDQIGGAWLGEHAFSGGIGFSLAEGHTIVDFAYESGVRRAGALRETFQTAFLGITVRP